MRGSFEGDTGGKNSMHITQTTWHRGLFVSLLVGMALGNYALAEPTEWKVSDGGNGHLYEAFAVPGGITWTDAYAAARSLGDGWHLNRTTQHSYTYAASCEVSGGAVRATCSAVTAAVTAGA